MELAVKVAVDPPLIVRTVSSLTVRILNWLENVTDPPPRFEEGKRDCSVAESRRDFGYHLRDKKNNLADVSY